MDVSKRPNIIPWPPLLLLCAIALGILLEQVKSLSFPVSPYFRAVGFFIVLAGVFLDLTAAMTMRKAQTNILPHRAADKLVTHGPFRFSRNPIYLGNVAICVGLAIIMGNPWLFLTSVLMFFAVDRLAIRREEVHLSRRFGAEWVAYRQATPRWLPTWRSRR